MHWIAEDFDAAADRGTTRPAFLRCLADGAPAQKCVILLVKSGLPPEQYASEFVGNRMARQVGITTPEPGLVQISKNFLDAVAKNAGLKNVILREGWAVGSHKLLGLAELTVPLQLRDEEMLQAQRLFALDVIGHQYDRSVDNPNAGKWQGKLVAFDFQLEFPWEGEVPAEEIKMNTVKGNRRNPFRAAITQATDFEKVFEPFYSLTPEWFAGVEEELPPEWRAACSAIASHVARELSDIPALTDIMKEAAHESS